MRMSTGWGGSRGARARRAGLTGAGSFSHTKQGERASPSAISPAASVGRDGEEDIIPSPGNQLSWTWDHTFLGPQTH